MAATKTEVGGETRTAPIGNRRVALHPAHKEIRVFFPSLRQVPRTTFPYRRALLPSDRVAREDTVSQLNTLLWKIRIWKDTRGQDLIEYALMAGFVAVAAGAIMPGVATSISTIFSKISSVISVAASEPISGS